MVKHYGLEPSLHWSNIGVGMIWGGGGLRLHSRQVGTARKVATISQVGVAVGNILVSQSYLMWG